MLDTFPRDSFRIESHYTVMKRFSKSDHSPCLACSLCLYPAAREEMNPDHASSNGGAPHQQPGLPNGAARELRRDDVIQAKRSRPNPSIPAFQSMNPAYQAHHPILQWSHPAYQPHHQQPPHPANYAAFQDPFGRPVAPHPWLTNQNISPHGKLISLICRSIILDFTAQTQPTFYPFPLPQAPPTISSEDLRRFTPGSANYYAVVDEHSQAHQQLLMDCAKGDNMLLSQFEKDEDFHRMRVY